MWLRLIRSTHIGGLVVTVIFGLVTVAGILSKYFMLLFITFGKALKPALEVFILPVTYRVSIFLNKSEKVVIFATETDFCPAQISV